MLKKIAVLIPEFPGQTHNFFWRERNALKELDVDVQFISTRRPHKNLMTPSWCEEALGSTKYLYPLGAGNFFATMSVLASVDSGVWRQLIKLVFTSRLTPNERLRLIAMIPFSIKLSKMMRDDQVDHLHVHSLGNSASIAMLASIISGTKYSVTLHSALNCFGANQEEKFGRAAFAIFVADKLRIEFVNSIGSDILKLFAIAPMGVDVNKFLRYKEYVPYNGFGNINIFTCARLNVGKGLIYLIDAIKYLVQCGVSVNLRIAGEDDVGGQGYRKILSQKIFDKGLQGNITLLGSVTEERVRDELELAHLFVLPSLNEAIGVSLMEAMAMGIPCIATKIGGIPELIENGIDGFLVEPENSHAIANAIKLIMSDAKKALSVSQLARDKIVANFHHRRSACEIKRMINLIANQ